MSAATARPSLPVEPCDVWRVFIYAADEWREDFRGSLVDCEDRAELLRGGGEDIAPMAVWIQAPTRGAGKDEGR